MNSTNNPKKTIISMVMVFFTGVVVAWNFSATAKPELPELPVSPEVKPSNLETWARDVLTGVAKERGVPAETVVTPENITFMLAWQKGEGGGTDGHCGRFNPLNTKYLKDGVHGEPACKKKGESFATVNYATYADGVAAAVYTITGKSAPYQTRIADALTRGMSAEDMAHVLAFPDEFGGDQKCWACPGGAGYEKSIKGSIDRLKSSPEAYRKEADKPLDGASEVADKPAEELPPPKAEFDDSSPVTLSEDGQFAFPLKVNREDILAGTGKQDQVWPCPESKTACHHDYPAADIAAPTGTPEVAFTSGLIEKVGNQGEGEKNGWIRLRAGDTCYVYAHILPTAIAVDEGQEVKVGELVGRVGRAEDAINRQKKQATFPHLHFDQQPCGGKHKEDPQPKLSELFERLPHRGQPAPPAPTTSTTTTAPPDSNGKSGAGSAPEQSAPATAQQMTVPSCGSAPTAQMPPGKVKLKCSTEYEFEYEPSTTTEPPEKSGQPDGSCDSAQPSSLSSDGAGDVEDVGQFDEAACDSQPEPSSPKDETTPTPPKSQTSPPDIGDRLDTCGLPKNLPHEIPPGRGGLTIDQQDSAPEKPKCQKPAALASSVHELGDDSSPYDDASDLTVGNWRGEAVETASPAAIDPVLASNPLPEPSGWPWQIFLLLVIPWALLCAVGTMWLQKRAGRVQLATVAADGANVPTQSLPPVPAQRDLSTRILIWCAKAPFRGAAWLAREISRDVWHYICRAGIAVRQAAVLIWPYVIDGWRQFSRGLVQLARQAQPRLCSGWRLVRHLSRRGLQLGLSAVRGRAGQHASGSYDTSTHVGRHRAVPSHRHRLRHAIDYYFRGSDPWV